MSVSVQELDNTVRAFFEGKGDVVRILALRCHSLLAMDSFQNLTLIPTQQKQAQQTLTEVSSPPSLHSHSPIDDDDDDATDLNTDRRLTNMFSSSSSKTPMRGSPWATFSRRLHTPRPNVG